jgi:hypothetical protein
MARLNPREMRSMQPLWVVSGALTTAQVKSQSVHNLVSMLNMRLLLVLLWRCPVLLPALTTFHSRVCIIRVICEGPEEEKLLGSILLPSYKISPCSTEDRVYRKFAFKAEHTNMRTYHFAADTRELMVRWMNALSLASILQEGTRYSGTNINYGSNREDDNVVTAH